MSSRFAKGPHPHRARVQRLEELAAALGDMITVFDRDGCFVEVSAGVKEMLGYLPVELEGERVSELVHPADADRVREVHAAVLGGVQETISYRVRRADGRYAWLETLLRPVRQDGKIVEVVCASREVTEREVGRLAMDDNRQQMRRQIEFVLRERLIDPVFQPIVDLAAERVVGYEALARFPAIPARPPNVWFGNAAEIGLGVDLELLAVERALSLLDDLPDDVYVSVNVSPATLIAPGLQDVARSVTPTRLVVELTEHSPIEDYEPLNVAITPLREDGVRLAVDDAGAGFASLRHILDMGPDIIKLDGALTRYVHVDTARRELAKALGQFAQSMDATVVAEGIEEPDQLQALRDLDITVGQGYLLGKPGPPPDREGWALAHG